MDNNVKLSYYDLPISITYYVLLSTVISCSFLDFGLFKQWWGLHS